MTSLALINASWNSPGGGAGRLCYRPQMDEPGVTAQPLAKSASLHRPGAGADLAACVAFARDRDPYGHRVHVITATIGCGLLTLTTVTATIALFGLVGWSIARSWVLWPLWLRLLRHPLVLLLLGFFTWSALSLTWSANVGEGLETLRSQRYLLLIPALVPVLGAVRWLLLGVLVGVMVQAFAQALVFCGLVPWSMRSIWSTNGGLSKHPGPASAWAVIAMGIAFSPGLCLPFWARVTAGLAAFGSVFMTAARSGLLAMAFTMSGGLVLLRGPRRWLWRGALIAAVWIVVATVLVPEARNARKLRGGVEDAWSLITTGVAPDSSIGIRWTLVRAGFAVGMEHPWAGVGLGAAREAIKEQPVFRAFMDSSTNKAFRNWQGDLHGAWGESIAELGVPGFVLFIVPVFMAFGLAVRHARSTVPAAYAWGPTVLAAVLTWLAFGMFNVVYSSGQLEAMAMLAATLAIGAGAHLFQTGTGMQRTVDSVKDAADA